MAVSNTIIAIINFLSLLSSIPIIAAGIWLSSKPDTICIPNARWPLIILGVLIFLVSLAGFVGAYWNHQCLLVTYLFCMVALIIVLLTILVLAYIVTRDDGSVPVAGRGYSEYRVGGYSEWLRRHVVGGEENWRGIVKCLSGSDVCGKLARDEAYFTADQFFSSELSPLQSGCCKPPTSCGYGYVNPTVWINPANPAADPDCYAWSNDQSQLCYGCESCKGGTLGNLRKEWRKANVALIVASVALIFVYVIGCSAFRNAQTEDMFNRYKQGWV